MITDQILLISDFLKFPVLRTVKLPGVDIFSLLLQILGLMDTNLKN